MDALHSDEIDGYRRPGWVLPRRQWPAPQLAAMEDALDELLRRNPGVAVNFDARPSWRVTGVANRNLRGGIAIDHRPPATGAEATSEIRLR